MSITVSFNLREGPIIKRSVASLVNACHVRNDDPDKVTEAWCAY